MWQLAGRLSRGLLRGGAAVLFCWCFRDVLVHHEPLLRPLGLPLQVQP